MVLSYLKLAFRRLVRYRAYSLVNLLGLTSGIAACLFIFLYVQEESSYDQFHPEHERIFRVTTMETEEGVSRHQAHAYAPLAHLLQTAFPEAKQVVRYLPFSASIQNPETHILYQEAAFYLADSLFFELFPFEFIAGDPATALDQPNAVILSKSAAERYFGTENPLGKTLLAEGETRLTVKGVLAPLPGNSTLQFDLLAAYGSARNLFGFPFDDANRGGWYYPPVYTFVKFPDLQAAERLNAGMGSFIQNHFPEYLQSRFAFHLQPLAQMHREALDNDLAPAVKPSFLYILIVVALLILSIACANYVNITLAVLMQRFRELGMRRVLGAKRSQVFQQLSTESYLFLGLSFLLALCLVQVSMPGFNALVDKQLSLASAPFWLWGMMVFVVLTVGLIISLLPQLAVFRFGLIGMLKNDSGKSFPNKRKLSFRHSFIVFQFAAAAALMIATVVILKQLTYIQEQDSGLQSSDLLVVPIRDDAVQNNYAVAKQEFAKVSGVHSVSAISNFPWEKGFYDFPSTIKGQGKQIESNLPTLLVERDFMEVMGMEMVEGRSFAQSGKPDSIATYIMNESAASRFGIEKAAGLTLEMQSVSEGNARKGEVIGIASDFNLRSLHHRIEPLVMTIAPMSYFLDNFVIRLETQNLPRTLDGLADRWAELAPNRPFEYFFLDEAFDQLYRSEAQMGILFSWFSILALLIACLGMFALASILCEQRTKEIGIRKVLGASIGSIVSLLSKDFLKLVFIALIIASPLAWYVMEMWLVDFAYRIDIGGSTFILVAVLALVASIFTVSIQSIRAALINPINSLRNE